MTLACLAIAVALQPVSPAAAGPVLSRPSTIAGGGLGISVMDVPAGRVADPRARAYIVDHLNPGTTIQRRVQVSNTSPEPMRVELYAGAASVENNTFTGGDGRSANDLSGWVTVGASSVDLPAGAKQPVTVIIAVPPTATQGEHYAAIWASIAPPSTDGGGIREINRVGIRVYLDVGPGGEPSTDFQVDSLAVDRGDERWPVVTANVHNTGGRALDIRGSLSMSDADRVVNAGPFAVQSGVTILPGHTASVRAIVDKQLPPGQWNAQLTVVSGTVQHTASAALVLPGPPAPAATDAGSNTALGLFAGGAGGLVILTVIVAVLLRRRRAPARS